MKQYGRICLAAIALAASLGGCATQSARLYYWGDYQEQVYASLKNPDGGDIAAQIAALEEGIEKAKAESKTLPPGYHAQLGMLYFEEGQANLAEQQIALEKSQYPESAPFMDRLLEKFKK